MTVDEWQLRHRLACLTIQRNESDLTLAQRLDKSGKPALIVSPLYEGTGEQSSESNLGTEAPPSFARDS
jgi:hypothetical protein